MKSSTVTSRPRFLFSSQNRNIAADSPLLRPAMKPSTLRSLSNSGQWMPSPPPISRQLFRSAGVPCLSLGYQSNGKVPVRKLHHEALHVANNVNGLRCGLLLSGTRHSISSVTLHCILGSSFQYRLVDA